MIAMEKGAIVLQLFELLQRHTALDAAADGGLFIAGEIDRRQPSQQAKDLIHIAVVAQLLRRMLQAVSNVGMLADARDFLRDAGGGHDEIDTTGRDRADRHAIVLRRTWFLGEGDARFPLDGLEAKGAIGCGSGKDNAHGIAAVCFG